VQYNWRRLFFIYVFIEGAQTGILAWLVFLLNCEIVIASKHLFATFLYFKMNSNSDAWYV